MSRAGIAQQWAISLKCALYTLFQTSQTNSFPNLKICRGTYSATDCKDRSAKMAILCDTNRVKCVLFMTTQFTRFQCSEINSSHLRCFMDGRLDCGQSVVWLTSAIRETQYCTLPGPVLQVLYLYLYPTCIKNVFDGSHYLAGWTRLKYIGRFIRARPLWRTVVQDADNVPTFVTLAVWNERFWFLFVDDKMHIPWMHLHCISV